MSTIVNTVTITLLWKTNTNDYPGMSEEEALAYERDMDRSEKINQAVDMLQFANESDVGIHKSANLYKDA